MEKKIARRSGLKGFVIGVIVTMMLSGTLVMANPVMRELVFGVGVSFNGEVQQFEEDMRPFVIDGRTFLPVRAIADIVGLDVDFDGATNMVILTTSGAATAVATGSSFADTFFSGSSGSNFAQVDDTATVLGQTHNNVVQFNSFATNSLYSQHNLGGDFTRWTGIFGHIDGVGVPTDVSVTITGDGAVLMEFEKSQHDMPVNIDLDVTGINLIRIDVSPDGRGGPGGTRGAWALTGDLR
ncbi:MAG: copper amine oxidase N-terminal domain-containing protein [Defluviitaleaceae bacterium]|nr:copper amine oxidase N-terminal domain-containing protein [Defluviitaleaceae bacterium]